MLAYALYAAGSYMLLNKIKIKESIIRINVAVPEKIPISRVDDLVSVFTSTSDMMINSLSLTTSLLGIHGITNVRSENKKVEEHCVEFTVVIHHRGSLMWSLKPLADRFKDCTVFISLIKKQ
jgi:hypothetical protein